MGKIEMINWTGGYRRFGYRLFIGGRYGSIVIILYDINASHKGF